MEPCERTLRLRTVVEAARDYRYLLNRGYSRHSSLSLVVSRYGLKPRERMILYRCIHPLREASLIRDKIVSSEKIMGQSIVVDGFNNIITIKAILRGEEVYLCDDGVVRDLSMMQGRIRIREEFLEIIALMLDTLRQLKASSVTVFYDKQVSRSGELASYTRRLLTWLGIEGEALTSSRNDTSVIKAGLITSSSDIVILLRSRLVFDLPGYIARLRNARITDLSSLLQ